MSSVETQEDIQDQEREEKIAPRKDKTRNIDKRMA